MVVKTIARSATSFSLLSIVPGLRKDSGQAGMTGHGVTAMQEGFRTSRNDGAMKSGNDGFFVISSLSRDLALLNPLSFRFSV